MTRTRLLTFLAPTLLVTFGCSSSGDFEAPLEDDEELTINEESGGGAPLKIVINKPNAVERALGITAYNWKFWPRDENSLEVEWWPTSTQPGVANQRMYDRLNLTKLAAIGAEIDFKNPKDDFFYEFRKRLDDEVISLVGLYPDTSVPAQVQNFPKLREVFYSRLRVAAKKFASRTNPSRASATSVAVAGKYDCRSQHSDAIESASAALEITMLIYAWKLPQTRGLKKFTTTDGVQSISSVASMALSVIRTGRDFACCMGLKTPQRSDCTCESRFPDRRFIYNRQYRDTMECVEHCGRGYPVKPPGQDQLFCGPEPYCANAPTAPSCQPGGTADPGSGPGANWPPGPKVSCGRVIMGDLVCNWEDDRGRRNSAVMACGVTEYTEYGPLVGQTKPSPCLGINHDCPPIERNGRHGCFSMLYSERKGIYYGSQASIVYWKNRPWYYKDFSCHLEWVENCMSKLTG